MLVLLKLHYQLIFFVLWKIYTAENLFLDRIRYIKRFCCSYPVIFTQLHFQNYGSLCKLDGTGKLRTNFSKRDRMSELRQWLQEPKNKPYAFFLLFLIIACCIIAATLFLSKEFTVSFLFFSSFCFKKRFPNFWNFGIEKKREMRRLGICNGT